MPELQAGLPPVVDSRSRILLLGSFPGKESLRLHQYYANPGNDFWRILASLYQRGPGETYQKKLGLLHSRGLALWDVLGSAKRERSLDSKIRAGVPNDFVAFFHDHPDLRMVGFNGTRARALFRGLVAQGLATEGIALEATYLPSSSSTPGQHVLTLEEKMDRWKQFLCQ